MRIIATYNIKGGVGKTSAAVNLAYLSASGGSRTLLWDLDPQGAASFLFRVRPKVRGGVKALVKGRTLAGRAIKGTDFDNLDLLPADFSYRNMDLELDSAKRPTRRLSDLLTPLTSEYDTVFLDCPPSVSLVSEGVLRAADTLLVPVVPATLSSRTLDQLTKFVATAKPPRPRLLAFFSMVDSRRRLHRDTIELLSASRSDIAHTTIPAASLVEQMGPRRLPLLAFAPHSAAALAYQQLWSELQSLPSG